jgi:DNA replication protein DnaC
VTATTESTREHSLDILMRSLKLPAFARYAEEVARGAEKEGWSFRRYLHHLAELEIEERRQRRIERNQRESDLPGEKTLATLNRGRLPPKVQKILPALCEGDFVQRGENLLAFGLPGRGKTHLACAIGHELIQRGRRVFFTPTFALVQRLLVAKRDLVLDRELARLDRFDAVILDDIGYVQQSREEMEVLFTFLSERYERRSVIITSNLVFMAVRRKQRKQIAASLRVVPPQPTRARQQWTMDFTQDSLSSGRQFRTLNVIDAFTRECLVIEVDHSLPGARVVRALQRVVEEHGAPDVIRIDNGTEFTSHVVDAWAYQRGIKLDFITPGKPTENGHIESFNGKFRDECLNENWFISLDDARRKIETYRVDYNEVRPHSSLDNQTPNEFARSVTGLTKLAV